MPEADVVGLCRQGALCRQLRASEVTSLREGLHLHSVRVEAIAEKQNESCYHIYLKMINALVILLMRFLSLWDAQRPDCYDT